MSFSMLSDAVAVPSEGGDFVDVALTTVRQHLDMEVAYLSEFVDGKAVFRAVSAPGLEGMIKQGDTQDLSDIYCQHILEGRLPNVIGDTHDIPLAVSLPITAAVPIRSHVSVPVHRDDGSVYGMFCCLSPRPNTGLNARDLRVMETFADIAKRQLHTDLGARARLAQANAAIDAFLKGENVSIVLQPIFPIEGPEPCGFEALCRFQTTPYRPPNEWFDEARTVGKQMALECAVIQAALRFLPALPAHVYMSINASPMTIASGAVLSLLEASPAERVVVEMTEHEVIGDEAALAQGLQALVARGARIAIDDVGAGYSGLSQILKMQPDLIKLDMELVRDIDRDVARQSMVHGLAEFGRATGATVLAEGIETEAELAQLRILGVDLVQGYLRGRPGDLTAALAYFGPTSQKVPRRVGA